MPQVLERAPEYDVCIIGSGAGGGMAAYVLTQAGANVVMLEAGPMWDVARDGAMFTWNYESPRRGASTTERPFGEFDACYGGWEIPGEPYLKDEGTDWLWFRARMLGGRTNHWGRISLRFGPDDFKGKSRDGYGDDWPISYEDLAPYYDKVDRLIGVFGSRDNFYNEPDGIFLPPPKPRCYELLVAKACEKLGIPVLASRLSILTRPLNGRAACHYCGQCNRGCTVRANFASTYVLLPPALETGRLTIIPNAMAREILVDEHLRARGVSYIDKKTLQERQVRARIVVLGASACETARLLLNSRGPRYENGLANSSGLVGRYLMDSTGTSVAGFVPALVNTPPHNEDGVGGMHIYVPWWAYNQKLDFPRGYHLEVWGGRRMPGYGFGAGIHRLNGRLPGPDGRPRPKGGGGYGRQLKEDYRQLYGAIVGFAGRGEMIARYENYCTVDPNVVDRYGIPVLRFHVKWSDEEIRQVRHMQETARKIIRAMGGEPLDEMPGPERGYGITKPGEIIHEAGTTRMGHDPKTSVLNPFCQAHDVPNLFVVDAGPFVSMPHKNPTWTILALAWRTAEYIVEQRKQGNL
jgi:choline dehydrogenase-like flavoprotein